MRVSTRYRHSPLAKLLCMCSTTSAITCYLSAYLWFLLVIGAAFLIGDFAIIQTQAFCERKLGNPQKKEQLQFSAMYFSIAGAVGLASITQWIFLLGLLKILYPVTVGLGLITFLGAAVVHSIKTGRFHISFLSKNDAPIAIFFLAIAAHLVALSLNAPGAWDDTSFHLPLARFFIEQHSLAVNEWLRYPLFPANGNLLFVLSLMVGNEMHAQVMANAVPLTLAAIGVYGYFSLQLKSPILGCLAILVLWSMRTMHESLGYAYIDGLYLLFCWSSMLAAVLATQNRDRAPGTAWTIICALLTGVMVGTKLFGTVIGGATTLILLISFGWRSRKFWLFVLLASIFGLGWYVRSFLVSGDPIHPAGTNIFGAYLWDAGDMLHQVSDIQRNPNASIFTIFGVLIKSSATAMAIGLFILLQPKSWRQGGFILFTYLFIYLAVWWNFFPLPRYLLAVIPASAALAVLFCYRAGIDDLHDYFLKHIPAKSVFSYAGYASLLLASGAIFYASLDTAKSNISNQARILQSRLGYAAMSAANAKIDQLGPNLVQLGFENAFYFYNGVAMGDWFGKARYRPFLVPDSRTPTHMAAIVDQDTLAEQVQAFDARMAVVNAQRFSFDPSQYQNRFDVELVAPNEYFLKLKPNQSGN